MSEINISGNSDDENTDDQEKASQEKNSQTNNTDEPGSQLQNDTDNENSPDSSDEVNPDAVAESTDEPESRFQEYFTEKVESHRPKMTDTLLTFVELKNIDEELADIEEEKGDLPESIDTIKEKSRLLQTELDEKKQSISKLDTEKSKLDQDNSAYEEKINKYDEKKFDVRSNKEYDEIVKAIDLLFEEVKKNELRIKEVKDLSEMLGTDVGNLEEKVNELNVELSEKQSLLDELNEQYKQDEVILREKRNSLVSKLDPQSTNLYERINSNYKGEATAIVRKGNCSGCYNSIPPQRVIEIRTAERIFTCQSCGRILVPEELLPA